LEAPGSRSKKAAALHGAGILAAAMEMAAVLARVRRRRGATPSIRTSLALLVAGVILPLIALAGYLGWQVFQTARSQVQRDAVDEVRERTADLEVFIQGWHQTLSVLVRTPTLRERHADEANEIFADLTATYPYLFHVAALDRNYTIWASAVPEIRGVVVPTAARERLASLLEVGEPGVSDPIRLVVDRAGTQRTFIFIYEPILDGTGAVSGSVQVGLPLDTLRTALRLEALSPGRPVLVVHGNGTVLAASTD
jgi:hypothetical protein